MFHAIVGDEYVSDNCEPLPRLGEIVEFLCKYRAVAPALGLEILTFC